MDIKPIFWKEGEVVILDQRFLPHKVIYIRCKKYHQVATAIKNMVIRGAPAIGIATALGIALGIWQLKSSKGLKEGFKKISHSFANTRPTAHNLFWAIERMENAFKAHKDKPLARLKEILIKEAIAILREDISKNKQIGEHGRFLIKPSMTVLTHCNAGALATGGYGTALGVIRAAWDAGIKFKVIVGETRPYLQGARLTSWELQQEGIPISVVTDSSVGYLMAKGKINLVIVGADRIAANGDVANKIGTYTLAVLAKKHHIPFYVAAPLSTFDLTIADGSYIPIEKRSEKEVVYIGKKRTCPEGVSGLYYAFDITPANYISGIITEDGFLSK